MNSSNRMEAPLSEAEWLRNSTRGRRICSGWRGSLGDSNVDGHMSAASAPWRAHRLGLSKALAVGVQQRRNGVLPGQRGRDPTLS